MQALTREDPALSSWLRAAVKCSSVCCSFHQGMFAREDTRVACDARWTGASTSKVIDIREGAVIIFVWRPNCDDVSSNGLLLACEVGWSIILPFNRIIGRAELSRFDRADRDLL